MQTNPNKFQAIISHRSKNESRNLNISNMSIVPEHSVKLLGVTIDQRLTFNEHIDTICMKASRQLNVLKRFSFILTITGKLAIYQAFILSHFNYCPVVWMFCSKEKVALMERIQFRALRFVYNDQTSTLTHLLNKAGRSTLHIARLKCLAIQVYKCLNVLCPA